ncbi:MAG: cysteine desulfurase [Omnitrophica WOR_2 bacterium SM23_29]|nr:MAG: cysteine desulfurase [Omnitrophica WOR_2 bacterium SM23_29]
MKKVIYLDNNSTTPLHPEALKAMLLYYDEGYGNASSIHLKGRQAKKALEESRGVIGDLLGTESVDIVFTSGGTESDNFAIKGVAFANRGKGNHIITSSVEHLAVLSTCKYLESQGFKVTFLSVDKYGVVDLGVLKDSITSKTILVTIMHSNNEVGTIQPIAEIARILKDKGIYFHTDAAQSFGKIPLNVEELGVDLLSISAHKIYGPKGVGALYIRKGVKIDPFHHGGHHERNFRAGTENIPGIVGLAKAAEIARRNIKEESERISNLRDMLHKGLTDKLDRVYLNGHPTNRLPGTLNLSFEGVEGESLLINFDTKGICASTGSACTAGSNEPSHVLMAMKVDPQLAQGSVRFSLGAFNTKEEISYCLEEIPKIVNRLRRISPLSK